MRIEIQPHAHWDPKRGSIVLTHANVEISHHRLGEPVRGNLELQIIENHPDETKGAPDRFVTIVNGPRDLTPEQLAAWKPADALQFAQFIVANGGLTPKA